MQEKVTPIRRIILLSIVLSVISFVFGAYQSFKVYLKETSLPLVLLSVETPAEFRKNITQNLRRSGPRKTYAIIKKAFSGEKSEKHNLVHIFGEEVYVYNGLSGIDICDQDFLFACFHGFMSRALGAHGIQKLSEIAAACRNGKGEFVQACMHGAGHGLVEYLGRENITEAILLCEQFGATEKNMNGCVGGAVMEYNFGSPALNLSLRPRPQEKTLGFPCTGIKSSLSPSCYFEQMQWLLKITDNNIEKTSGFCSDLIGVDRVFCFRGIGNFSVVIDYDINKAKQRCEEISERADQDNCKIGAASSYMAVKGDWEKAREICRDIGEVYTSLCPQAKP